MFCFLYTWKGLSAKLFIIVPFTVTLGQDFIYWFQSWLFLPSFLKRNYDYAIIFWSSILTVLFRVSFKIILSNDLILTDLSQNRSTPTYDYYTLDFQEACSHANFKSNL